MERKHNLFVEVEELLREVQERLLWWVEARNRAKGLMVWALKSSPKNFYASFEVLRDSCKEVKDCLGRLKKIRRLQFDVWRVETTVRINLSVDRGES